MTITLSTYEVFMVTLKHTSLLDREYANWTRSLEAEQVLSPPALTWAKSKVVPQYKEHHP